MLPDEYKTMHCYLDKLEEAQRSIHQSAAYADVIQKWEADACASADRILEAIAVIRQEVPKRAP